MQTIVLKRAVPFRTETGTIITDTIITAGEPCSDGALNVVAIIDHSKFIVRHATKCVFSKNAVVHTDPFTGSLPS